MWDDNKISITRFFSLRQILGQILTSPPAFLKQQGKTDLVSLRAGRMSLGTLISRISGFLRDIGIAALFSPNETDIFFAALRFPGFFRRWIGEGSFSASVTPVLTESLHRQAPRDTARLFHCLGTWVFCLSGALTLAGVVFMEDLVHLFFASSPAYAEVEGKLTKTVVTGRLVFSYLFFVSLYAYFLSSLQAFGRFFLPAMAPALFNISLIGFSFSPKSWWPFPSYALAWAVVVGGILQLLPVLYEISRQNLSFRFQLRMKNPLALKALRSFPSGMIGLSVLSLTGMINIYFAGKLPEGAISYIYYGDRLLEFPRALIALSLGSALVPELTRLKAFKKPALFRQSLERALRMALFLTLPCALVFALASRPLIEILFERGRFGAFAVSQTAMILQIYSPVLLFTSLSRVLSSAFFALDKNKWLAICALFSVVFHWFCAHSLSLAFGLKGLAGASALSSLFYFVCLLLSLFYMKKGFGLKNQALLILRSFPGLILLGFCLVGFSHLWELWFSPAGLWLFPALLLIGGGLYLLSAFVLKEPCAFSLIHIVGSFFAKRKKAETLP